MTSSPVRTLALGALVVLGAGCGAGPDAAPPLSRLREIESPARPGSGEPSFAVGDDGRVYLSWLETRDDGSHALRLSIRSDDRWSEPVTVVQRKDLFVNWADFPSVVPLPDGSLAAHWLVRTGRGAQYDIHVARSSDGGATWGPAVVPHRDGTISEHGFVTLLPGSNGSIAAVWLDGRKYAEANLGEHDLSGEMTLRLTTLGPQGVLGRELLLDDRTCDCCQTAAAMTDDGPLVVYRDRSPDEVRDIAITRFVDRAWTEPRPVHEDGWVIAACPVNGPAAAAEGRRVAVAWFTAARDTPRVRLAFSDDAGATFAPPIRVDDGQPAGRVDVELLPDGQALVTWLERTGQGAEVRVRRVAADGTSGRALTIATSSAERASGFPRSARAGGQVYFAWTEPGSPAQVRVASARLPRGR